MWLSLAEVSARGHHHSSGDGPLETLVSWIAHAAIWRMIWKLPTPALIVIGAVAVALFVARGRRR